MSDSYFKAKNKAWRKRVDRYTFFISSVAKSAEVKFTSSVVPLLTVSELTAALLD